VRRHVEARAGYGLELMVERGTGCGPIDCCSSDHPMHAPLLCPVHGTPSISGMSGLAALVLNPLSSGELGNRQTDACSEQEPSKLNVYYRHGNLSSSRTSMMLTALYGARTHVPG
jgi:hypothetical protein